MICVTGVSMKKASGEDSGSSEYMFTSRARSLQLSGAQPYCQQSCKSLPSNFQLTISGWRGAGTVPTVDIIRVLTILSGTLRSWLFSRVSVVNLCQSVSAVSASCAVSLPPYLVSCCLLRTTSPFTVKIRAQPSKPRLLLAASFSSSDLFTASLIFCKATAISDAVPCSSRTSTDSAGISNISGMQRTDREQGPAFNPNIPV
mmetsp:Transcript_141139/g.263298  ORF Transcript_141139/g.263298 Transcript_141139/m.263298 type:complete len:202 (-) Transcript_141139:727-1332(-)